MKRKKLKNQQETEFEADSSILEIDLLELDREWSRQPKLYHEYADQLSNARKRLNRAEAEMKVVKAEIDRDIRSKPESFGLAAKPTEVAIANTVILQKKHRRAVDEVIEAQHLVDMLFAMVNSLEQRKTALENEVKLLGQRYFADPRADEEGTRRMIEDRKNKVRRKKAS